MATESPLADAAREVLGGTPSTEYRPDDSPVTTVLPPPAADPVHRFDLAVDRWFDRLRGRPVLDRLFYGASALGDFSLVWHLISVARANVRPSTSREAVRIALALGVESVAVNGGVKSLFRRPRPVWHHPHARPHGLRAPRSSSFPSGHATSGFLAASLLSAGRPRQRPLWFGLAAVVAASRVHVRIHHASDVVGGAALGTALGALVTRRGSVAHRKGRS
jgi:undecaprenyl-diphosphatase